MTKEYKTYRNSVLDRTYHHLLRSLVAELIPKECT
jgi:hypothetical protein